MSADHLSPDEVSFGALKRLAWLPEVKSVFICSLLNRHMPSSSTSLYSFSIEKKVLTMVPFIWLKKDVRNVNSLLLISRHSDPGPLPPSEIPLPCYTGPSNAWTSLIASQSLLAMRWASMRRLSHWLTRWLSRMMEAQCLLSFEQRMANQKKKRVSRSRFLLLFIPMMLKIFIFVMPTFVNQEWSRSSPGIAARRRRGRRKRRRCDTSQGTPSSQLCGVGIW